MTTFAVRLPKRLRAARRTWVRLREDGFRAALRRRPIERDTIFYESFNGNGVLCNPEALFRRLLADPERARLRHVWSLSDENDNRRIRAAFDRDDRVRFVRPGSRAHLRAQLTSKYLVSNATFDRQFAKRPGQVFVDTWHGTPLKKMGFDIGDPAFRVANVLRTFLHADLLVSPNSYTTATLYGRAHRLDGIYGGRILELGSPRIDRQSGGEPTAARARGLLAERGIATGGRRIVLWAPTWKGTSFVDPENDAADLLASARALQGRLGDEYVVLLKTHQVVHRFAAGTPGAEGLLVPNDIPTNLLLAATAVLVTDYSSVFFDFLSLRRPIVFLAPDLDDYAGYRGLYLEPDEWPGPVTRSVSAAAEEILRLDSGTGTEPDLGPAHEALRLAMTEHDDGHASERVIAATFDAPAQPSPAAQPIPSTHPRPRILLALSSAVSATRLDQALELLGQLDLDAVDVSVVLSDSRQGWYLNAQTALDPRIRQFVRQGHLETPPTAWLRRHLENRRGHADAHRTVASLRRVWDHEWHRLFADVRFDLVVDLVATEPFWLTLLLHSGAPTLAWTPEATRPAARPGTVTNKDLLAQFDRVVERCSPDLTAEVIRGTLTPS